MDIATPRPPRPGGPSWPPLLPVQFPAEKRFFPPDCTQGQFFSQELEECPHIWYLLVDNDRDYHK